MAAEAAVRFQLAQEAQVQADHYAALAEDGTGEFSETLFAYDLSGHLIGEYLTDGTVLREYVWLEDQPLALLVPGGVFGGAEALYYHVDQLNTPQRLTDATGQVVWDAVMQPFGEVEVVAAEVEQNLRFPGQYFDAESGLHYNYFRDYDPVLGRYRESDPIGIRGGINLFEYASGTPLNRLDRFGLSSCGADGGRTYTSNFGAYSFEAACAAHDACYKRCGASKSECDSTFAGALFAVCAGIPSHLTQVVDGCFRNASNYGAAVSYMGGPAYRKAQENCDACTK